MSFLDSIVNFAGGDLTPGFNLPSAGVAATKGAKTLGYSNPATALPTYLADRSNLATKVVGDYDLIPGVDPFTNRSGQTGGQQSQPRQPGNRDTGGTVANPHTGGGSMSSWTPQQQALYETAVNQAQTALGRIPDQVQTGIGNARTAFDQNMQSLNTERQNAAGQRDQATTTTNQNYRTSQNRINQTASQDQNSLLRLLSAMGAGTGSEATYTFPRLVGEQAAQQLGGAAQNQAQNLQGIDNSYNTFLQEAERREKALANQRDQNVNQVKSSAAQNRISLKQTLAQLAAERAQAIGGDVQAAVKPFLTDINQLAGQINQLSSFDPRYTGETPDYVAPELSSFAPAESQRIQANARQSARGGVTPLLDLLTGRSDEDRRENEV